MMVAPISQQYIYTRLVGMGSTRSGPQGDSIPRGDERYSV